MFSFNLFAPESKPPIATFRIAGYLVETVPCEQSGCSTPYHTRVTYLDPWTGSVLGRCPHAWNHSTFLAAIAGHHRIVRALTEERGADYELATRQTCAGGGLDVESLFGVKPTPRTDLPGEASLLSALIYERMRRQGH